MASFRPPSDVISSTPIEALVGPRAFAYEILAQSALSVGSSASFKFVGARMPLDLVPDKAFNGILAVDMQTELTSTRFTMPVKPIFQDIDVAAHLGAIKSYVDPFLAGSDTEVVWKIADAVDNFQIKLRRSADKVKAILVQQPMASKTRVITTAQDLIDDDNMDEYIRGMGQKNSSSIASAFETIFNSTIVKDLAKESRYFQNVLERFFVALREMRITPKHALAVAALMNVTVDEAKISQSFDQKPCALVDRPKTPWAEAADVGASEIADAAPLPEMPITAPAPATTTAVPATAPAPATATPATATPATATPATAPAPTTATPATAPTPATATPATATTTATPTTAPAPATATPATATTTATPATATTTATPATATPATATTTATPATRAAAFAPIESDSSDSDVSDEESDYEPVKPKRRGCPPGGWPKDREAKDRAEPERKRRGRKPKSDKPPKRAKKSYEGSLASEDEFDDDSDTGATQAVKAVKGFKCPYCDESESANHINCYAKAINEKKVFCEADFKRLCRA